MIEGVKVKTLKIIPDERGKLLEILGTENPKALGAFRSPLPFIQPLTLVFILFRHHSIYSEQPCL